MKSRGRFRTSIVDVASAEEEPFTAAGDDGSNGGDCAEFTSCFTGPLALAIAQGSFPDLCHMYSSISPPRIHRVGGADNGKPLGSDGRDGATWHEG